jgi:hypothetical protein
MFLICSDLFLLWIEVIESQLNYDSKGQKLTIFPYNHHRE